MAEQKKSNTCLILGVIGAITVVLCVCMKAMLTINGSLVPYTSTLPIIQITASSLSLQDALTISILSIDAVEVRCDSNQKT